MQPNTGSGRQNRRPKYLQDYDQSVQKRGDEDENEDYKESSSEAEEEDEDDTEEEEYVNGRYRPVKRNKKQRNAPRSAGRGRASLNEPNTNKRQKVRGSSGYDYLTHGGNLNSDLFGQKFGSLNNSKFGAQIHKEDDQTIELQGNLLLIYKKITNNQKIIDNLNIVLKGQWKIKGNRQEPQDFIYKKSWNPLEGDNQAQTNELLLKQLFFDDDVNTMIDSTMGQEKKNLIDLKD